jgi:hypothetical protein
MPPGSRIVVVVDKPGQERIAFEVWGTVRDWVDLDDDGRELARGISVSGSVLEKTIYKADVLGEPLPGVES